MVANALWEPDHGRTSQHGSEAANLLPGLHFNLPQLGPPATMHPLADATAKEAHLPQHHRTTTSRRICLLRAPRCRLKA